MSTGYRAAGASDPGRVRKNNEDRIHVDPQRGIFLVVDGVGGQAAGEKAAEVAVEMIRGRLERQTGTAEERVREAIAVANNEILRLAKTNPQWEGMACVLTLALMDDGAAVVGHVGDSRLYKLRKGRIEKITHDHSPVGEREDARELSEAEAMRHPRRNEVYRDVGSEPHAPDDPHFIETARVSFEADSTLLLCSDGLSDMLPSAEIRRLMEQHAADPDAAVAALIEAAKHAGGKDNVSAIVVAGEGAARAGGWPLLSRGAFFVYGFVLALAGAAAAYQAWPRPPAPPPLPRTLVVGTGQELASIGAALAEARPGDTIEVLPGEYSEQIHLKSGVKLRSRVPGGAILRTPVVEPAAAVIAENVRGAVLDGFRILAEKKLAVGVLLHNAEVEMNDIEVAGPEAGIEFRGASRGELRASSVHDCGTAVVVGGTAAPRLSHNGLVNAKHPGLLVREDARPVLVGNVFERPEMVTGADHAVLAKFNYFLTGRRRGAR